MEIAIAATGLLIIGIIEVMNNKKPKKVKVPVKSKKK
jgi:hypothetical protein